MPIFNYSKTLKPALYYYQRANNRVSFLIATTQLVKATAELSLLSQK